MTELDDLCDRIERRIDQLLPVPPQWAGGSVVAREVPVGAVRERTPERRPEVPGWVTCPEHDHAWRGLRHEVCGVNGGPNMCNRRAIDLTTRKATELMRQAAA